MRQLAGAFRCGEEAVVRPEGERLAGFVGGGLHEGAFVVAAADTQDLASRGAGGRWSPASSFLGHARENIRPRKHLTSRQIIGHNKGMTTNEARKALTDAIAARTACVTAAQQATGRKASALYRQLEDRAAEVDFAARRVEMAVRAENPTATEAEIQRIARAA